MSASALGTTALVTEQSDHSSVPVVGGEAGAHTFAIRFTTVGDGYYAAGGTSGLPAKLAALAGKTVEILSLAPQGLNLLGGVGYQAVWIPGSTISNGKMALVLKSTGVELAGNADASACTFALVAYCR